MSSNKQIMEEKVINYTNSEYSIQINSSWEGKKINENQTIFFGPKVGDTRIGFYITTVNKDGKNYLNAAEKTKKDQSIEKEHTVIEELDISKEDYKAFMRRSCWYNEQIGMNLFIRDVFVQSKDKIFILSGSIPNSTDLEDIDKSLVQMMNSFTLR